MPPDLVTVRIACRTGDWPAELEIGLQKHWRAESVGVYELLPLRRIDVRQLTQDRNLSPDDFLKAIVDLGAEPLASRPITLKFLLNLFDDGKGLPSRAGELYLEGCQVLCDEWRQTRARIRKFSTGQRFALACRLAAVIVFCGKASIVVAPLHRQNANSEMRMDELLGGTEAFKRESVSVDLGAIAETLATALFRSRGENRHGFSHQTYAEYLAARYLVNHNLPFLSIRQLIFHEDGSCKVIPQLRATAGWLATMLPEVFRLISASDPETLTVIDGAQLAEPEREEFVRQLLRAYDSGELIDQRLIRSIGRHREGARLRYPALADDLRQYLSDKDKGIVVRRVAISIVDLTHLTILQPELLAIALGNEEQHEVKKAAVAILSRVGNEATKSQLKQLLTDQMDNDPDDEIKGGVLHATWPNHLAGRDLFSHLSAPKKSNFFGLYQSFLAGEIGSGLQAEDIRIALDWTLQRTNKVPCDTGPLGKVCESVLLAAIGFWEGPGVCEGIADILLVRRESPSSRNRIAVRLQADPLPRRAIAAVAIRRAPDLWSARRLVRTSVIVEDDLEFLLSQFDVDAPHEHQVKVVRLIADLLCWIPWIAVNCLEAITTMAGHNRILCEILKSVLGPIDLSSDEAGQLRQDFAESRESKAEPQAAILPQIDEWLLRFHQGDALAFENIALSLLGNENLRQSAGEPLLPNWDSLPHEIQGRIVETAAAYFKQGCQLDDVSYVTRQEFPSRALFGFWALRLLAVKAPTFFRAISENEWRNWMPCVFGDPYSGSVVDERYEIILRAAYAAAPDRFFELLGSLMDFLDVGDRILPIWDEAMTAWLRVQLKRQDIEVPAFRRILAVLGDACDLDAAEFATELLEKMPATADIDTARYTAAALELLSRDAIAGFHPVWYAMRRNDTFSSWILMELSRDPYSKMTSDIISRIREDQLANLYIALRSGRTFAVDPFSFSSITPERAFHWLSQVVLNALARRGTPAALAEIRRIAAILPAEPMAFISKSTEELIRRKTWRPLSPEEFLNLVLSEGPPASSGLNTNDFRRLPVVPPEPASANNISRPPRRNSRSVDTVRITNWMVDEGWTVETLAVELGVTERTVSSVRTNGTNHGRRVIERLAKAMGIDFVDLLIETST